MRIVMLTDFWPTRLNPISGVFVQEQVSEYENLGHELTVVAPISMLRRDSRPYRLTHAGATVFSPRVLIPPGLSRLPGPLRTYAYILFVRASAHAIRRVLRRHVDIDSVEGVHANGLSFVGSAITYLPELHVKRCVITVHGEDPMLLPLARRRRFCNLISRLCDAVTCVVVCGTPLSRYASQMGIPNTQIRSIPNGTFLPDAPIKAREADHTITIITIANLTEYKNVAASLIAFSNLNQSKHLRYTIVGDGPKREALERLANDRGVSDKVTFVGRVYHAEAMSLLSQATIFCLPSIRDACPISFIEAMGRGKPVVGAFGTGAEDFIQNEVNGFLVNPRDIAAITAVLQRLVTDPALRGQIGERALRTARQYTWTNNVEQYLRILRRQDSVAGE